TLAKPAIVVLLPPTVRRNVRLVGVATTGAMNVAFGEVGLMIFTIGWPGVTICSQKNGPFTGLLPAAVRVMVVAVGTGVGWLPAVLTNQPAVAVAWAVPPVVWQLAAGGSTSGNGFSWPITWLVKPFGLETEPTRMLSAGGQVPMPLTRKGMSRKLKATIGLPMPRFSAKMNSKFGA